MKILIAGDSFAQCDDMNSQFENTKSWCVKLRDITGYSFTNIAAGGSSLLYTYKQLKYMNNLNEYDKIIVMITTPGRISFNIDNTKFSKHFVNYSWVLHEISKSKTEVDPVANAAKLYYEYIYDEELDLIAHYEYVDQIRNRIAKDKLLLIKTTEESYHSNFDNNIIMNKIGGFELKNFFHLLIGDNRNQFVENYINHANHMTDANNTLFAMHIKNLLEGSKEPFDYDKVITMDQSEFDKSFTRK